MYNADLNDYKADEALAGSAPEPLRKVAICTLCDDDIDLEWEKHLEIDGRYFCAKCMHDTCEEVSVGKQ